MTGDIFLPQPNTASDGEAQPVKDPNRNVWTLVVDGVEVYGRTAEECKINAVQWGSAPSKRGKRTFMTTLESVGRRL